MGKDIFKKWLVNIFLFFVFSFAGYIWECSLYLVQYGELINRGTMIGPWLPIYGCGGLLVLFLLKRFKHKPTLVFVTALLLCSTVEYFTSYYLEVTRGIRWWDYSEYFININGRICLEGCIIFGLAGCLAMYVIGPFMTKTFNKIPSMLQMIICLTLLSFFTIDFVYSTINPNTGERISSVQKQV